MDDCNLRAFFLWVTVEMSKQLCPDCGQPRSAGAPPGMCPSCLLRLGLEAWRATALAPEAGTAFGDYELLEEIARGGMGAVFRARQVSLNRIVALKMLLPGIASPEWVRRFRAEATAAAALHHPGIVAIHEVGEHQGQPYFSMEFLAGPDLSRRGRAKRPEASTAARWARQVATAVHHAHERGVLHRDLKPANVLLDESDVPRVTDFGLAKLLRDSPEATVAGQVMGTPSFMSPEQLDPRRGEPTIASDVYGIGTILYFLLTGKPPFEAETIQQAMFSVLNTEPAPPRSLNSAVPRDLEIICLKCLAKDPARRYRGALEVAEELQRFLEHKPILARPATAAERLRLWAQRNPVVATLTLLLVVTVSVALVTQWKSLRDVRAARDQTEENVRYLLESLAPQLSTVGRSAMMADVFRKVRPYFEEQSRARTDSKFRRLHAGFLLGDALLDREMGSLPSARAKAERALEVIAGARAVDADVAWFTNEIAAHALLRDSLRDLRDAHGALRHGEAAVALAKEALQRDPGNGALAAQLAEAHFGLGAIASREVGSQISLPDVMQANHERGAEIAAELATRPGAPREWWLLHARSFYFLGRVWRERRELERAEKSFRESLRVTEELLAREPGHPDVMSRVAEAHLWLADAIHARASSLRSQTNATGTNVMALREEAWRQAERGLELAERLTLRDPGNVTWQRNYAHHLMDAADKVRALKRQDEGTGARYAKAHDIFKCLTEQEPQRDAWWDELSEAAMRYSDWCEKSKRMELARALHEQNVENQFAAIRVFPDRFSHHRRLAVTAAALGYFTARGQGHEARLAVLRGVIARLPDTNGLWRWSRSSLHGALVDVFYEANQPEGVVAEHQIALKLRREVFADHPHEASVWPYLANSYRYLGGAQAELGRKDEALATAEEGLRWLEANPFVAQSSYETRVKIADLCSLVVERFDRSSPQAARVETLAQRCLEGLFAGGLRLPPEIKARDQLAERLARFRTGAAPPP